MGAGNRRNDRARATTLRPLEPQRRQRLRSALQSLVGVAVLSFIVIYVYGLFSPAQPPTGEFIDFSGLEAGQAVMGGWRGRPVWILRRSPAMLQALRDARRAADGRQPHPDIDPATRSLDPEYGVYLAQTARPGVLVQFTGDRPRSLPANAPWDGGFLDPGNGRIYDAAGRAHPDAGQSYPPLEIPPHRHVARQMIKLGSW